MTGFRVVLALHIAAGAAGLIPMVGSPIIARVTYQVRIGKRPKQ